MFQFATNSPPGQSCYVAQRDPNYSFEDFSRGPDHLPRRLTPKVFDELHCCLDPLETSLQPLDRYGYDRPKQRANDAQEAPYNRRSIRRRTNARTPTNPLDYRHSGWAKDRNRIAAALWDVRPASAAYRRFVDCGSKGIVCRVKDTADEYVVVANYCRHRWCVPCANARSSHLARVWQPILAKQRCRFVTLTLRSSDEPLADTLDRLYACYRRLQRSKLWAAKVEGSVAFLEVKVGKNSGKWHPHLHVICSGKYLPAKVLSNKWLELTGDSHVVDVRLVEDAREVARYITKYATKPGHGTYVHNRARLREAITALAGRRMMIRQGTYRDYPLRDDSPVRELVPIISLRALLAKLATNDEYALAVMRRIYRIPDPKPEDMSEP